MAAALSSFLGLTQEKKQKKVKASAEAWEAGRVRRVFFIIEGPSALHLPLTTATKSHNYFYLPLTTATESHNHLYILI